MVGAPGATQQRETEMTRAYDDRAEKVCGLNIDPFWRTRIGKLILLAVFLASIGVGAGIGYILRLFGWS